MLPGSVFLSMKDESFWTRSQSLPAYPAMEKNTVADVVIIGAGLTGLLSAYLIAQTGRRVVILEKDRIASGATGVTTAFLTQIIDTDVLDLITIRGAEEAQEILMSHADAIDLIENIAETENIRCDFERCTDYIYAADEDQLKSILAEFEAMDRIGLQVSFVREPLPHIASLGAIAVGNQAKFNPMKFIAGLLPALERLDVAIFEQTEAVDLDLDGDRQAVVRTLQGLEVTSNWIISAAYEPFGQPLGLFFKKGMYVSYVIEAEIPKSSIEYAIYEDADNPYHYFRAEKGSKTDTLIIGGEDHRKDIPVDADKNFAALEEYMKKTFPGLKPKIRNRWSGPILEPADGLPLIGPYKDPRVLYASGFSGNGMTYAGIAAIIFRDIVENVIPSTYGIYRADRSLSGRSLYRKAIDYGQELIRGAGKNIWRRKRK